MYIQIAILRGVIMHNKEGLKRQIREVCNAIQESDSKLGAKLLKKLDSSDPFTIFNRNRDESKKYQEMKNILAKDLAATEAAEEAELISPEKELAALKKLDALLDQMIILRTQGPMPSGPQLAERKQKIVKATDSTAPFGQRRTEQKPRQIHTQEMTDLPYYEHLAALKVAKKGQDDERIVEDSAKIISEYKTLFSPEVLNILRNEIGSINEGNRTENCRRCIQEIDESGASDVLKDAVLKLFAVDHEAAKRGQEKERVVVEDSVKIILQHEHLFSSKARNIFRNEIGLINGASHARMTNRKQSEANLACCIQETDKSGALPVLKDAVLALFAATHFELEKEIYKQYLPPQDPSASVSPRMGY